MSLFTTDPLHLRSRWRFLCPRITFILIFLAVGIVHHPDLAYAQGLSQKQVVGEIDGGTLASVGNLKLEVEGLKKALALNPTDADAHNRLGHVLIGLKEYDEAVGEFRTSLILRPNSLQFANDFALALTKIGELDQAITLYESLIRDNPKSPEIHSNYGLALWQRSAANRSNDLAPVIAAFRKALECRPDDPGLYNNLGQALNESGDVAGALECFRKAIQTKPDYAVARTNL